MGCADGGRAAARERGEQNSARACSSSRCRSSSSSSWALPCVPPPPLPPSLLAPPPVAPAPTDDPPRVLDADDPLVRSRLRAPPSRSLLPPDLALTRHPRAKNKKKKQRHGRLVHLCRHRGHRDRHRDGASPRAPIPPSPSHRLVKARQPHPHPHGLTRRTTSPSESTTATSRSTSSAPNCATRCGLSRHPPRRPRVLLSRRADKQGEPWTPFFPPRRSSTRSRGSARRRRSGSFRDSVRACVRARVRGPRRDTPQGPSRTWLLHRRAVFLTSPPCNDLAGRDVAQPRARSRPEERALSVAGPPPRA